MGEWYNQLLEQFWSKQQNFCRPYFLVSDKQRLQFLHAGECRKLHLSCDLPGVHRKRPGTQQQYGMGRKSGILVQTGARDLSELPDDRHDTRSAELFWHTAKCDQIKCKRNKTVESGQRIRSGIYDGRRPQPRCRYWDTDKRQRKTGHLDPDRLSVRIQRRKRTVPLSGIWRKRQ